MLSNYLERAMSKYKNVSDFLSDLKRDYPERLLQLLDVEYKDEELLDYISERTTRDFYVPLFRDGIAIKRVLMDSIGSPQINTVKSQQPITGEMALDQITGEIMVYDGSCWMTVVK